MISELYHWSSCSSHLDDWKIAHPVIGQTRVSFFTIIGCVLFTHPMNVQIRQTVHSYERMATGYMVKGVAFEAFGS